MKKLLIILMFSALSFGLNAQEKRTFAKLNNEQAQVTIQTEETDSTQAAMYVDGQENVKFIEMLLKDKTSGLSQLKSKIEIENCETTSTDENPWIDGCGEVTITSEVRTAFGRGGWMSGDANYTFFIGFTQQGTGRYFTATHMVTIYEGAEAETNDSGEYTGTVIKHLTLVKIAVLP
jgi:hypothetical protein